MCYEFKMKKQTMAIGILGIFGIVITSLYFLNLYKSITQLILVISFAGFCILVFLLYLLERVGDLNEEVIELNNGLDRAIDYTKQVEEKNGKES